MTWPRTTRVREGDRVWCVAEYNPPPRFTEQQVAQMDAHVFRGGRKTRSHPHTPLTMWGRRSARAVLTSLWCCGVLHLAHHHCKDRPPLLISTLDPRVLHHPHILELVWAGELGARWAQ